MSYPCIARQELRRRLIAVLSQELEIGCKNTAYGCHILFGIKPPQP